MSQHFYWTEIDGPIDSGVDGQPHDIKIIAQDGLVQLSVNPFGNSDAEIKFYLTADQVKSIAFAFLQAGQSVGAISRADVSRGT